jgi:hypothetical protein
MSGPGELMLKLYIYNEKQACYYYDEAWVDGNEVVEHVGKVGTTGRVRRHPRDPGLPDDENVRRVLEPALRGGYREIPLEEHASLVIEYRIDGFGSAADLDKRHRLEARMNELLGWAGIGICDGGSIGSGSMEVFCDVVDFAVARKLVEKDLAGTEFADYSRIYDQASEA